MIPSFATPVRDDCFTSCKVGRVRHTQSLTLIEQTQGTFAETHSPEDQLRWIFENGKVVRAANGLSYVVEAVKIASSKHDFLWYGTSYYHESDKLISKPNAAHCQTHTLNILTLHHRTKLI